VLALVVSTTVDDAELASDALWSLGVVAIEERSVAGEIELWTSLGDDADAITTAAAERLQRWGWRFVEVDETLAETWRAHAMPVYIGADFVICPAWVPFEPEAGVTVRESNR
jgi:hypothetical protein